MKLLPVILIILLFCQAGLPGSQMAAQDVEFRIVDFVRLPDAWNGNRDTTCFMEFHEQWSINSRRGSIVKKVTDYTISCSSDTLYLEPGKGFSVIGEISHEFVLLDPHLTESGNRSFSSPDSMDVRTRALQAQLIALINGYIHMGKLYQPENQLLSLYFHEEWVLEAGSGQLTKIVKGITPVMWQRRQTTTGEFINEPDTGLPVYYKNKLIRIDLRNP